MSILPVLYPQELLAQPVHSFCQMEPTIPPIAVLPLPSENDSLSVLTTKLSSFLYVIHVGRSVAVATGYVPDKSIKATPESRAVDGMRPHERDYFEAWKERSPLSLPSIDWDTDRGHTPVSQRPLKKAQRRAEALNRIYKTDKAEPCHYTHFVENNPLWVPLVTAVARVIGAERNQKETLMKPPPQRHELQVLRSIVQVSMQIISQADEDSTRARALEKTRFLEAAMKRLQSEQRHQEGCLGKRKRRQEEGLDEHEEFGDSFVPESSTHVQRRLDVSRDTLA